jgi:WhiB family redox-sensing transcriptional regulator
VTSLRHLEGWRLRAVCAGMVTPGWDPWNADEDLTRAQRQQLERVALDTCARCPVRDACLTDALVTGEAFSIRGGTTPAQRRALAVERGLPRPSPHGAAQHGTRSMRCTAGPGGRRCPSCAEANARYVAGWRARRSSVTHRGLIAVVHVLETPTGTGRRRAWPGQLFIDLRATA